LVAVLPEGFLDKNTKKILVIERVAKRFGIPTLYLEEGGFVDEEDLRLRIMEAIS
jgi:hypothetical protein